jgi:gliding motility-associated-like protein
MEFMRLLLCLFVLFVMITDVFGQQSSPVVIASGGGFSKISGIGSISFTIGEPIIQTAKSGSIILTQGFQQPETPTGVSECVAFFPTAFSPENSAGLNDTFLPVSSCVFSYFKLFIYDRWGQLVFESNDQLRGWDGSAIDNKKLLDGLYVYIADYQFKGNSKRYNKRGQIMLTK